MKQQHVLVLSVSALSVAALVGWLGGIASQPATQPSPGAPVAVLERVVASGSATSAPAPSLGPVWSAMQALGARVEALEEAPPPQDPLEESDPQPQEIDLAQALAEATAQHEDALSRHGATPYDAAWAESTGSRLQEELTELGAERKFTVDKVDCRSTSCVVTLGWSGYGMAMADATEVLHRTTSLPCANRAFLPPPDDADAPYETRIIFDCAE
ncbi:MAG: hypothetical protein KC933_21210 [Myxococcales bacterium]|nr:hypothetical protein [Myxococcales bacterium]MCB9647754.1 hypothetical protein [Deltaproteobacteria bacterium]